MFNAVLIVTLMVVLVAITGCEYKWNVESQSRQHTVKRTLYRIYENNRFGYIDTTGKVVIPPRYEEATDFVKGLAIVRENGLFGYINQYGEYVIAPVYEYATEFSEGLAVVCGDTGKPMFINRKGEEVFKTNYATLGEMLGGCSIVKSVDGLWGVIDKSGKVTINTEYDEIRRLDKVAFVVSKKINDTTRRDFDDELVGVIRKDGKAIIPLMKNAYMSTVDDRYVYRSSTRYFNSETSTINTYNNDGNLLFSHEESYRQKNIFKRPWNIHEYCSFHVKLDEGSGKCGVVDCKGKQVIKAEYEYISRVNDKYFYMQIEKYKDDGSMSNTLKGIVSFHGDTILEPIYDELHYDPEQPLILGNLNGFAVYITRAGNIVWREPLRNAFSTNISYKRRAEYFRFNDLPEIGSCDTCKGPITEEDYLKVKKCAIAVQTSKIVEFEGEEYYKVVFKNTAAVPLNLFNGSYLMKTVLQAKDKFGQWRDVDTNDRSLCGGMPVGGILFPGKECRDCIPVFEGSFKTKMRLYVRLMIWVKQKNRENEKRFVELLSNEFDTNINPAQLWRVPVHWYKDITNTCDLLKEKQ